MTLTRSVTLAATILPQLPCSRQTEVVCEGISASHRVRACKRCVWRVPWHATWFGASRYLKAAIRNNNNSIVRSGVAPTGLQLREFPQQSSSPYVEYPSFLTYRYNYSYINFGHRRKSMNSLLYPNFRYLNTWLYPWTSAAILNQRWNLTLTVLSARKMMSTCAHTRSAPMLLTAASSVLRKRALN